MEKSFNESHDSFFVLDDMVTDAEYIQLETNDNCLIGSNARIYASKDDIITMTNRQILLFSRKDGKFIREIASFGEAPGNFTRSNSISPFNEKERTVTLYANNKRRSYSLEGDIKKETIQPDDIFEAIEITPTLFAGFNPNFSGNEENKLTLFDEAGNSTGGFINHNHAAPAGDGINVWRPNGWFYGYQDKTCFYELFTDTVFQITPSSLLPHFILYQGKYLPPYEKKNSSFEVANHFMMRTMYESDKYIFYTFSYQENIYVMVYDKDDASTKIYNNTITSFVFSSINSDNELVGFIESYDLEEWDSKNPLTVQQKKSMKETNETDNPILVIGKLRTK